MQKYSGSNIQMRFLNLYFLFCLFCLSSCGNTEKQIENNSKTIQIYLIQTINNQEIKLKAFQRPLKTETLQLKDIILALLKGPSKEELQNKIGTEIPKGTHLIWLEEDKEKIRINLSEEFAIGGGSESMILRYKQLSQSIAQIAPTKPVYILVEGKELKTIGGEGLVVEQPIYEAEGNNIQYKKL